MSRRASQRLRQFTEAEEKELQRMSRASSEPRIRHQRAVALLAVDQSTNAILHPWLCRELAAILKTCPPPPEEVPEGRRWQDWDPFPQAWQLDRFFPPLRMLLLLDNLAGHYSRDWVRWCQEQGIGLLYTPCAGSWLNMAESVQRILIRRALEGHHISAVEILKDWLRETIQGCNRHPTPFIW